MKLKQIFLVFLCVLSASVLCTVVTPCLGQNLVPNPSFETVNCPTTYTGFASQIENQVSDWYSGNCASPDVMTHCSDHPNTRTPDVWYGWQHARTGTSYLAFSFYMIGSIPWYEYLGTELKEPLAAGQSYDVSFWLSRADSVRFATDAIGMYFSTEKDKCIGGFEGPILTYTPQVKAAAGTMITDTSGWVQVTGTYVAQGGETHILIGCFSQWDSIQVEDIGHGMHRCYYFLDDVSVMPGVTGVDKELSYDFTLWPNPASQFFRMKRTELQEEVEIAFMDLNGRILHRERMSRGEAEISVEVDGWQPGIYIAEVATKAGVFYKKIVVRW